MRLWIIQEIVLSAEAVIICGSLSIGWNVFSGAATLIYLCRFLHKDIHRPTVLLHVRQLGRCQKAINKQENLTLWQLLARFANFEVSNDVDRIFGLLGMVDDETLKKFAQVDYGNPGQVFQVASELIICNEQHIGTFLLNNWAPYVRPGPELPSWVTWFGDRIMDLGISESPELHRIVTTKKKIFVENRILTLQGLFLDSVASVSANFTKENFKTQIIHALGHLSPAMKTLYGSISSTEIALLQTFMAFDHSDNTWNDFHQQSLCCVSRWTLEEVGINTQVIERNPRLQILSSSHPELEVRYPEEVEENIDVKTLCSRKPDLAGWVRHAERGEGKNYERQVKRRLYITKKNKDTFGRNFFTGTKGYVGVGPAGSCRVGSALPAVEVDDCIFVLAGAYTPVILRKCPGGIYKFVGNAYIGSLLSTAQFKQGHLPELIPVRIC